MRAVLAIRLIRAIDFTQKLERGMLSNSTIPCPDAQQRAWLYRTALLLMSGLLAVSTSGCWAPLRSHGIPARCLPDHFRAPMRTAGTPLNFSNLTIQPPVDYILGPNDVLEITIPGLFEGAEVRPIRVQVMASGEIHLPMVGPVAVGDKNLLQAQQTINDAYADGFLVNPRVSVALAEKSNTSVLVLGKVKQPGVHILPKFENDVGHALAAAGGLLEESAEYIEVHRRIPVSTQKPVPVVATNQHGSYPVQMAGFSEDPSGFTTWIPDAPASSPVGYTELQLNTSAKATPTPPVQPPVRQQPAVSVANRPVVEPWQVPVADSVRESNPSLAGTGPWPTPSTPWQPPVTPPQVPTVPTEMALQGNLLSAREPMPVPAQPMLSHRPMQGMPAEIQGDKQILRIPLRQMGPTNLSPQDITLQPGDVVLVPSRRHEVFYVVGRLNSTNSVRFTIGDREREIGVGFILPREREIDVVTAVAMAGYIDPIDSPTTVTVHRTCPDGRPMLIHVDLIKARYDCRETVLVKAGDIIYLNPDSCWWWRRTFDRIVPDVLIDPFRKGVLDFNQ
ncbi:MAG: polysaccharide export protein [Pirellulales bacterium]|nr:polysaccharide export protein [Pirellulales bacterium]